MWILSDHARQRRIEDDYALDEELGRGSFGRVCRAQHKASGIQRAVKSIIKPTDEVDINNVRREVATLHLLSDHDYIAELVGEYEDVENVHLVFELATGGSLLQRIQEKSWFTERQAATLIKKMVETVHDCHKLGVMHRDLKPDNWVFKTADEDAQLLLVDFGLSTFFKRGQIQTNMCGTMDYLAPEVVTENYNERCDVWSVGAILYCLLSGFPPRVKCRIDLVSKPWNTISSLAKDLIGSMLALKPENRISMPDVLRHPWLTKYANDATTDEPLDPVILQRLRCYCASTRIRQAASFLAAEHLSSEQIQGLKELFDHWDHDGSGTLELAELKTALHGLNSGLSDKEIERVFRKCDVDNSNSIDFNEFKAACTCNHMLLQREEILRKMFDKADADRSQLLNVDEIVNALLTSPIRDIPRSEVEKWVQEADDGMDGSLDFEEFIKRWRLEQIDKEAINAAKAMLKLQDVVPAERRALSFE